MERNNTMNPESKKAQFCGQKIGGSSCDRPPIDLFAHQDYGCG